MCLPRSISRRWELDRILVNAFGYLNSLTKSKYGSKWKSLFSSLYNYNLGCLFEFRSLECQPSTNFCFIVILISLVFMSGWSISQPYCWAISLTLLTHVREPWLCKLRNAVNTCLIIVFPGISANLRYNVNTLMWICTLGGTATNSPSIISLLVLTFRIHLKYQRNTLSISWFSLDDTPHTSLRYNSIGYVNVSKIYIINLGGRTPIFPNFSKTRNIAFRPFYQTTLLWFLAHWQSSCSLSKIAVSNIMFSTKLC